MGVVLGWFIWLFDEGRAMNAIELELSRATALAITVQLAHGGNDL